MSTHIIHMAIWIGGVAIAIMIGFVVWLLIRIRRDDREFRRKRKIWRGEE